MTNYSNIRRAKSHYGTWKSPYPTPQRPKFASCDRLPPAQVPRRTWSDFFDDVVQFFIYLGLLILIIEVLVQVRLYYSDHPLSTRTTSKDRKPYYDILGVDHRADQETITEAWRRKEQSLHPDAVGDTKEAREDYYRVQLAYVELSDPRTGCYHDQFYGFKPRPFRKDDPCTKILVSQQRNTKQEVQNYATEDAEPEDSREEGLEQEIPDQWLEWKDALLESAWKVKTDGKEAWETHGKRIFAWPFYVLVILFGLIGRCFQYIAENEEKYPSQRLYTAYTYP